MRALLFNQRRRNNWDKHVGRTLHVLRGRQNDATGMSPSEALLGYRLPREGEWEIPGYIVERNRRITRQTRLENVRQRQLDFQRRWYQQRRRPQVTFRRGQRVMTREAAALKGEFGNAWSGPHTILRKLSEEVYEVEKSGSVARTHVDDIRPAPPGNPVPQEVEVLPEEPGNRPEPSRPTPETDTGEERSLGVSAPAPAPRAPSPQPGPSREITGPTLTHRGRRVRLVAR